MNDVDRLLHAAAIGRVKSGYFRHLDLEDWPALEALFAAEVVVEFPGRPALHGREALLEALQTHHRDAEVVTVHHGHMPEIDVADDGTATGVWAMSDYVDRVWHADGRREAWRGYGHYHDEFVHRDGSWVITSMRLTRIRVDRIDPTGPFPHRGAAPVDVHRQLR